MNTQTRQATQEDFYRGSKLFRWDGNEVIIQDKYDEKTWVGRIFSGSRLVGDIVIFEDEAHFHTVKVEAPK